MLKDLEVELTRLAALLPSASSARRQIILTEGNALVDLREAVQNWRMKHTCDPV